MQHNNNKVLILTPSFDLIGGVADHYRGLKSFWSMNIIYEVYGRRKKLPAFITFLWDICKYFLKLLFFKPDIVVINPSFRTYQLYRDGIYLLIANFLKIKIVTFFHGCDKDLICRVKKKPKLFKWCYNKSKLIYVLSNEFKNELNEIGIIVQIKLTTTKITDNLLYNFNISTRNGEINEILFLARIFKTKGIFITIYAFQILILKYPYLKLRIVGDGPDLRKAKILVNSLNLKNVNFRGPILGNEISNEFKSSQLYILPTFEEGMPTSVLEAMAFGLVIITRPVGGLNDFFQNNKMGNIIKSFDPSDFAFAIENYINNKKLTKDISFHNYNYAINNFLSSKVVKNLELDFNILSIKNNL